MTSLPPEMWAMASEYMDNTSRARMRRTGRLGEHLIPNRPNELDVLRRNFPNVFTALLDEDSSLRLIKRRELQSPFSGNTYDCDVIFQ